jgi:penicillin-binding protein 1A
MATKTKIFNTLLIIFWVFFVLPIITIVTIFTLISSGAIGYIPPFDELENPKSNLATEIFSSDQQLLGKFYIDNRTVVEFEDLSPNVINALIATEDIRFYKHSGIDFQSLARVLFKTVILRQNTGGGSTITQQLAKNLYEMREQVKNENVFDKVIMKFQEWVTAVLLERNYTKEEILVMYLNTVTYGHNAFGIQTAAFKFFGKSPEELNLQEAATLVGLLKAPTKYSPKKNYEKSFIRRNVVISQIKKYQSKLENYTGWKPLTEEQLDSISLLPIVLDWSEQDHNEGLATYFREYLRLYLTASKPDFSTYPDWNKDLFWSDSLLWEEDLLYGWCNKNIKPNGEAYNIYRDGLKIYTTINSTMQEYAESAMKEHLGTGETPLQELFEDDVAVRKNPPFSWELTDKDVQAIMETSMRGSERYRVMSETGIEEEEIFNFFENENVEMEVFSWSGYIDTMMTPYDSILYYKKFLRSGFVSIEPQTGYIKAYVGGIDYNHFKYDHVMVAKRQVGSTFKPFVYTLAMMNGYSPCHEVANVPITIQLPEGQKPPTWTPQYSESSYDGKMISLRTALALSLNQISAWVMDQFSPEAVVEVAQAMGVKSHLEPVVSLCVGSCEVKLIEMVSAYCTFVNKGVHVDPVFVTRIEDKNGNTIVSFSPGKNQAFDENTAYRMIELMRGVVSGGTSSRIRYKYGLMNDIAGKTGTTNENSDGWFIGMTPNLVSGAWVGGEERSIRFTYTRDGQGASMALPIWALYMQDIYACDSLGYSTSVNFEAPQIDDGIESDCGNYNEDSDINNYLILDGETF